MKTSRKHFWALALTITSLTLLSLLNTASAAQVTASKNNADAGITFDMWSLSGNYATYNNLAYDLAGILLTPDGTILRTISGSVDSTLYGSFEILSFKEIYRTSSFNAYPLDCPTGGSLSLSGLVRSPVWGDFVISPESHACLNGTKLSLKLESSTIGMKDLSENEIIITTDTFQNIKVNGVSRIVSSGGVLPGATFSNVYKEQKFIHEMNVNKQLELLTRGKTPDTTTTSLSKSDFEKDWSLKYFDYNGQEAVTSSNLDNRGKILKLNEYSLAGTPSNYKMKVSGQKVIVVKGGNLYINADIYNENDSDSLLIIIVKRGEGAAYRNGGNIYIDPDVTNIDAVLIADGSIMNFNGSATINPSADSASKNTLRRQLLIYGQVSSNNTVGAAEAPYGSDAYIKYGRGYTGGAVSDDRYDISKFRTFEVIPVGADDDGPGPHCGADSDGDDDDGDGDTADDDADEREAPKSSDGSVEGMSFSWAGKKQCHINGPVEQGLRGTRLKNPVIIMYNSNIQIMKPFILEANN